MSQGFGNAQRPIFNAPHYSLASGDSVDTLDTFISSSTSTSRASPEVSDVSARGFPSQTSCNCPKISEIAEYDRGQSIMGQLRGQRASGLSCHTAHVICVTVSKLLQQKLWRFCRFLRFPGMNLQPVWPQRQQ